MHIHVYILIYIYYFLGISVSYCVELSPIRDIFIVFTHSYVPSNSTEYQNNHREISSNAFHQYKQSYNSSYETKDSQKWNIHRSCPQRNNIEHRQE